MMRAVTTGSAIAGNMAFKQAAVNAAEPSIDAAVSWLAAQQGTATLNSDQAAHGYFSVQRNNLTWNDPDNWQAAYPPSPIADAAGNLVRVTIDRMCTATGAPSSISCATVVNSGGTSVGSSMMIGAYKYNTQPMIYYRVTAQVQGPRNTVSYIQTIVQVPQ